MELLEVVKYLRDNGYLMVRAGKYVLSKKFSEDKEKAEGNTTKKVDVSDAWDMRYLQFVKDAGVPTKIETGRGEYYVGNAYTEPAMKVFKHIILSGIDYAILVKSTKLYYQSGAKWKKKISNYLLDGDWNTDYMNLVQAMEHQNEDDYTKTVIEHGPIDNWSY